MRTSSITFGIFTITFFAISISFHAAKIRIFPELSLVSDKKVIESLHFADEVILCERNTDIILPSTNTQFVPRNQQGIVIALHLEFTIISGIEFPIR
jgi:hypothetical protein